MNKLTIDQCKEVVEKASTCSVADFYTPFGMERFVLDGADKAALEMELSSELQASLINAMRCAFRSGCIAGLEAMAPSQLSTTPSEH